MITKYIPKRIKNGVKPIIKSIGFEFEKKAWFEYINSLLKESDPWLSKSKNLHKNRRCFILATGPSLNKIDLSKLNGEICFGVNGTYMIEEIVLTYFVLVSDWYWKNHLDGIKNVRCARRFIPNDTKELESSVPTTWYRKSHPKYGKNFGRILPVPAMFSYHPHHIIFAGGTVIYVCLQLAYYMGFKTVVLLGVDHSYRKNEEDLAKQYGGYELNVGEKDSEHFRSDYNLANISYHVDLNAMERGYKLAKIAFEKNGRKILNASPGTKLNIYPKVEYKSLF